MSVEPPPSRFITLRNAFFSGVLLLAPLAVTIWAFSAVIDFVGKRFRPIFFAYVPETWSSYTILWDLLSTIIVVVLVTGFGYLSRYVLGKYFFSVGERFVQSIPGVNAVYNTVKQIVDTFGTKNRNLFNKVVLVEFPRQGTWSIGFLTNRKEEKKLGTAEHREALARAIYAGLAEYKRRYDQRMRTAQSAPSRPAPPSLPAR